jgi:LacI family transcriptional regulator
MRVKKVTLADIAKECGVTTASVSMILSNKKIERFSQETLDSVRQTAARLNYKTISRRSNKKLILIVCPSIYNPYYATLVQSMEMEAFSKGYTTITFNTYWDSSRENEVLSIALEKHVDGVIFAMIPQKNEVAIKIKELLPIVIIGDRKCNLGIDTVEIDNYLAGRKMGKFYIDLGHKEFAYISTPLNEEHSARTERLRGLTSICLEHNIQAPKIIVKEYIFPEEELNYTDIEYNVGYALALECLTTYKNATALVAMNDMIAYGVLDAVKSRGFSVPEDYSVSGFDNIFPSKFIGTELTTIDHYIIPRGKKAFKMLSLKLDEGSDTDTITRIEYGCTLINRKSVGAPKTK